LADIIYHLDQVSYRYFKSVPVLADIDLSVYKGEKLLIMGANGCGKSTLLKLLDGLIFPTSGKIEAFGQILSERSLAAHPGEFRRQVGFVFQDPDVQLFCATVLDEVAFAPLHLGMKQVDLLNLVNTTLRNFGLEELQDRPPFRLSGGEKKKVALAAVMIYNPEVLILDEPTNGLDPRTKRWFLERLAELNHNGTTIIVATHDLEIGENFADRVMVMNEQHGIAAVAPPKTIFGDNLLLSEVNLI